MHITQFSRNITYSHRLNFIFLFLGSVKKIKPICADKVEVSSPSCRLLQVRSPRDPVAMATVKELQGREL